MNISDDENPVCSSTPKRSGPMHLYFGCRYEEKDFIFGKEIMSIKDEYSLPTYLRTGE